MVIIIHQVHFFWGGGGQFTVPCQSIIRAGSAIPLTETEELMLIYKANTVNKD